MPDLQELLQASAAQHNHLCPRQVLGVRMGLYAGRLLDLPVPQADKRLFTFMETDGCAADGVSVATGCWTGRRTMRLIDYGKVAATFVDGATGQAVRIIPHPEARLRAMRCVPDAPDTWHAMREGYQVMPDEELFVAQPVTLTVSLA
ncbi:MAG: formylmethanofuran dehydrogenase, partial [Anaerolineae bacterium]|nr:formylmethanofuran dehydrogenase [Anaerolineae bacterium]